ncbi:MAG: TetR family transcriptional regulator [Streptosporangiales bacterium]|nr:TetR family transcriptional regulator [Streptosporangiales bacterium]
MIPYGRSAGVDPGEQVRRAVVKKDVAVDAESGDNRERILDAARRRFTAQGYTGTTIRQIAADVGVDLALVHYFFGTKDALFVAAMELPLNPATTASEMIAEARTGDFGVRLVRRLLDIWQDAASQNPMLAMVRSAATHDEAARMLREFFADVVVGPVVASLEMDEPELRVSLASSQITGLAFVRHVIQLEPLASADPDTVAAWVGPTIQRYLTAPVPNP